jgi:hypothetical protein
MSYIPLESRLLVINSEDAPRFTEGQSSTNFTVNLEDSSAELRSRLKGVSVESVSFVNVVPNIRPDRNTLTLLIDGAPEEYSIPGGYYTIHTLAAALTAVLPVALLTVTVAEAVGLDGGDRLSVQAVDGCPYTVAIAGDQRVRGLAHSMGMRNQETLVLAEIALQPSYQPTLLMTNLQGEHAVQLHSTYLAGSRYSLNGTGGRVPVILVIPLGAPYGSIERTDAHTAVGGPTLCYGPQTLHDLQAVDLSLRYLDGTLIDMMGTNLHVTVRLWVANL